MDAIPQPILDIDGLKTRFFTRDGVVHAVDGVSFAIHAGETLGIVGESGCGKSVTAMSILRLLPPRSGRIVAGAIRFQGRDLTAMSDEAIRGIRGNDIAMIFQEPMTSLNPVMTVGDQIAEAVRIHRRVGWSAARAKAAEMLSLVRIPDAATLLRSYPHQLSGGMRQRVMIAIALSCSPKLLIADEPTTALDVTIQAQILRLMIELKQRTGASIMLITHDLGVIAETAQRVIVMYAGRIVEQARVADLFARPLHPYTAGLMNSMPRGKRGVSTQRRHARLQEIPGMVPSLRHPDPGCAFAPRCALAADRCRAEAPPMESAGDGHLVACWERARLAARGQAPA
ncbi:MAG: ABC transporter ATP-binding protein [Alphaproteobacteria bacterium]|nr:ABC transporter ATP-binding protein [Alphaproteobacteria bacterium]